MTLVRHTSATPKSTETAMPNSPDAWSKEGGREDDRLGYFWQCTKAGASGETPVGSVHHEGA